MSFDKPTRNLLAKMTAAARDRLAEDTAAQLQTSYGLYPDGSRLDVAQQPEDRHAAAELRALLDHFESAEPEGKQRKANAYQRLVREIGFTLLNRLAALRLCEERGLVIECVRSGMNSGGFQLYDRLAGGALGNRYHTYRAFLACMFDELAADLGALFDRSTPQSAVFPSEPALNDVLTLLNDPELASRRIWQQDETIGWIYQYYNDPAERKKMRDESQAPRNSRELAVRNQFFTPRYVVEFLTDNTLGRTWYEMCHGQTKLTEQCHYLVQRRHPIFLAEGQEAPVPFDPAIAAPGDLNLPGERWVRPNPELESIGDIFTYALTVGGYDYARQVLNIECSELANSRQEQYIQTGKWEGSFEELRCCLFFEQRRYHHFGRGPEGEDVQAIKNLHKAICEQWDREVDVVPFRAKKDPRRLRVLDPACGSGHFLLYAFDLLETIYAEAYDDPDLGADLQDAFPERADFSRQVPRLILENNLHGIDIDPRAAQIAALALWLRAQRAWQAQKLGAAERPQIGRTHIVVAEPMPGDEGLLEEFIADLPKDQYPEIIGPLVRTVFEKMKLAGEAGSLLKIEEELKDAIEQARAAWNRTPQPEQLSFLSNQSKPKQLGLDLTGVTDESFWQQAEGLVMRAMEGYARQAENGKAVRRQLFAGDAAQGFAFINLCQKRYDVTLMNPPFGEASLSTQTFAGSSYQTWSNNLLCAFIERGWDLLNNLGAVGVIFDRTAIVKSTYEDFRRRVIIPDRRIFSLLDLGWEVLDANVEVTAIALFHSKPSKGLFVDLRKVDLDNKEAEAQTIIRKSRFNGAHFLDPQLFQKLPNAVIGYDFPSFLLKALEEGRSLSSSGYLAYTGHQFRTEEHFRLWWEVSLVHPPRVNRRLFNGAGYSPYVASMKDTLISNVELDDLPNDSVTNLRNKSKHLIPGICFGKRGEFFCCHVLPSEHYFSLEGLAIPIEDSSSAKEMLGILNTPLARSTINRFCGQHKTSGYVNLFPYRPPNHAYEVRQLVDKAVLSNIKARIYDETQSFFLLQKMPPTISAYANAVYESIKSAWDNMKVCEEFCLKESFEIYNVPQHEKENVLSFQASQPNYEPPIDDADTELGCINWALHSVISHAIGACFGRWDIRSSLSENNQSIIPDPFSPLPKFPPGMMLDNQKRPVIVLNLPSNYPLVIANDGILVDDPGVGDHSEPAPMDIMSRVESYIQLVWGDYQDSIVAEACQILGIKDLREYFRKPTGFFANHLKRYSKSRRQAPIYWPLSTASGNYTLWIYYQHLNSEILYTAINRFVSPKIEQVERYLDKLEDDLAKIFGRSAGELRDKVDSTQAFLTELNQFRTELLRVANLPYKPDLNDGVIINAAPLYKLFRLTKWSRDCQAVWEKLEVGEYDWAHMAYVMWPDRVREKCKSDKSLAIAHGLQELYQGEEKGKKGKRKKSVAEEQERLGF